MDRKEKFFKERSVPNQRDRIDRAIQKQFQKSNNERATKFALKRPLLGCCDHLTLGHDKCVDLLEVCQINHIFILFNYHADTHPCSYALIL